MFTFSSDRFGHCLSLWGKPSGCPGKISHMFGLCMSFMFFINANVTWDYLLCGFVLQCGASLILSCWTIVTSPEINTPTVRKILDQDDAQWLGQSATRRERLAKYRHWLLHSSTLDTFVSCRNFDDVGANSFLTCCLNQLRWWILLNGVFKGLHIEQRLLSLSSAWTCL